MIIIESNPRDRVYDELINLAFELCDEFHLVLRKDLGPLEKNDPVLDQLINSLKEMKEQSEWASTILGEGQTAFVYYYSTDDHAKEVVKKVANSLYDWEQPFLPDDLSFFKKGKVWLVNIAHEKESYIKTEDQDEIQKVLNIKGIKARVES